MKKEPCIKERDEYLKAMEEWVHAQNACLAFVSTEPIDPHKDIVPLTIEQTEQLVQAHDLADKAYEKYLEAMRVYTDCKRKFT